ncbi:four helix bundle protein [Pontibacter sp. H259]|uniref:four helix bundle protein n=1 Tax=Pontibacter sp. H259 TaxID=3133421 RepID=UPI0030C4A9CE
MLNFTDLDVWKKCRELANDIYTISKNFPKDELFGLTNQIRRAAVSVISNIAEGCGRQHSKDAIQFFYIARGSVFEVEAQIYIAFDQKYITEKDLNLILEKITSCKQLLNGFINYYKKRDSKNETLNTKHN